MRADLSVMAKPTPRADQDDRRGVTLFEVTGGQIAGGRLYLEDVERDVVSIEQAVEDLSGRRPRPAHQ
jgi:hypothetical protein